MKFSEIVLKTDPSKYLSIKNVVRLQSFSPLVDGNEADPTMENKMICYMYVRGVLANLMKGIQRYLQY